MEDLPWPDGSEAGGELRLRGGRLELGHLDNTPWARGQLSAKTWTSELGDTYRGQRGYDRVYQYQYQCHELIISGQHLASRTVIHIVR